MSESKSLMHLAYTTFCMKRQGGVQTGQAPVLAPRWNSGNMTYLLAHVTHSNCSGGFLLALRIKSILFPWHLRPCITCPSPHSTVLRPQLLKHQACPSLPLSVLSPLLTSASPSALAGSSSTVSFQLTCHFLRGPSLTALRKERSPSMF